MTDEPKGGKPASPPEPPFRVTETKTAVVIGEKGRPSLELERTDDMVKVTLLPKNSSSRDRVRHHDLREALEAIK